jgi:hypothetical protein
LKEIYKKRRRKRKERKRRFLKSDLFRRKIPYFGSKK